MVVIQDQKGVHPSPGVSWHMYTASQPIGMPHRSIDPAHPGRRRAVVEMSFGVDLTMRESQAGRTSKNVGQLDARGGGTRHAEVVRR